MRGQYRSSGPRDGKFNVSTKKCISCTVFEFSTRTYDSTHPVTSWQARTIFQTLDAPAVLFLQNSACLRNKDICARMAAVSLPKTFAPNDVATVNLNTTNSNVVGGVSGKGLIGSNESVNYGFELGRIYRFYELVDY